MIVIKKIKPMFTALLVTMDKYGVDECKNGLIDAKKMQGMIKEIQKVVEVGSSVRDIEVGNLVKVNPAKYAVHKHQENSIKRDILEDTIIGYNIPQVEVDGQIYMLLQQNDIEYVITEYAEEKESPLIHQEKSIIQ